MNRGRFGGKKIQIKARLSVQILPLRLQAYWLLNKKTPPVNWRRFIEMLKLLAILLCAARDPKLDQVSLCF